jgi:hypothetical protein
VAVAHFFLVRPHAASLGTASGHHLFHPVARACDWLVVPHPLATRRCIENHMVPPLHDRACRARPRSWSAFCSCVRRFVRRGDVLCHVRSDRSAHRVVHHRYHVFLSGVRASVAKSQHLRTHVSLSTLRPQTQTGLTTRWSPTALWRCASMSILISVSSTGAQPRSQSGGSAPSPCA